MRTKLAKARTGYYEIRWSEGGRSRTVSTRTGSLVEAKAFRAAWIAAQREAAPAGEPTVAQLVDEYQRLHVDRNGIVASQTWSLKPIKDQLGALTPSMLGPVTIDDYRADRMSRKRKDGTIRRELGALSTVLKWAKGNRALGWTGEVPAIALPPPSPARVFFLPEEDEIVFHARAMGESVGLERLSRITRFVALALDTGARKEAIEGLEWSRVDMVRGLIDFRDPGVKATKKRRVVVPISKRLLPLLERAKREAVTDYVLDHNGDIRSAWRTFRKTTAFPKLGIHDLRRTWASLAVAAGVDIVFVAAVLGDTVETTMKHYAHLRPEYLRGAVDARWK